MTGTLAQLIRQEIQLHSTRPVIFSPCGMDIFDLALGKDLYDEAFAKYLTIAIPDFLEKRFDGNDYLKTRRVSLIFFNQACSP